MIQTMKTLTQARNTAIVVSVAMSYGKLRTAGLAIVRTQNVVRFKSRAGNHRYRHSLMVVI